MTGSPVVSDNDVGIRYYIPNPKLKLGDTVKLEPMAPRFQFYSGLTLRHLAGDRRRITRLTRFPFLVWRGVYVDTVQKNGQQHDFSVLSHYGLCFYGNLYILFDAVGDMPISNSGDFFSGNWP